jgi:hypothetical protein
VGTFIDITERNWQKTGLSTGFYDPDRSTKPRLLNDRTLWRWPAPFRKAGAVLNLT